MTDSTNEIFLKPSRKAHNKINSGYLLRMLMGKMLFGNDRKYLTRPHWTVLQMLDVKVKVLSDDSLCAFVVASLLPVACSLTNRSMTPVTHLC